MTREDVKKQLVKSPLVWAEYSYATFVTYSASLYTFVDEEDEDKNISYRYDIDLGKDKKWCQLVYFQRMLFSDGRQRILETNGYVPPMDEIKKIAENHRLDLICQMLGVDTSRNQTDQQ